MANPRKFSEKIALHNQKQAEETAAFEKIMREVSDATSKVYITYYLVISKRVYNINQFTLYIYRSRSGIIFYFKLSLMVIFDFDNIRSFILSIPKHIYIAQKLLSETLLFLILTTSMKNSENLLRICELNMLLNEHSLIKSRANLI